MKKIRIGKDFKIRWTVGLNGQPVDLRKYDLKLEIRNAFNRAFTKDFVIENDNTLVATFFGREQKMLGVYSLTLWANLGMNGQSVLDNCNAFELVKCTCEEAPSTASNLTVETVDLQGTIEMGVQGLSAYQTWLKLGHTGTETDFINWLREPATNASEVTKQILTLVETIMTQIIDAETVRDDSEQQRVTAEQGRVNAENQRVTDETARRTEFTNLQGEMQTAITKGNEAAKNLTTTNGAVNLNENLRKSNEAKREEAEAARANTESARIVEEGKRAASESARSIEEAKRVTNESNRNTEEGKRVNAENLRKSSEGTREANELARVNAENQRGTAEQSRANAENQRTTSEQARVSSETARSQEEAKRVSEEAKRVAEEAKRASSEAKRVQDEAKRVSDENTRNTSEQQRATAEAARAKSEADRKTSEQTRNSSESTRVAQENARVTEFARLKTESENATQNASKAATDASAFKSFVTEYNVSKLHPTQGIGGTNKFTLAEAIKLIPADMQSVGIKCSFVAHQPKDRFIPNESYQYCGGAFEDISSWTSVNAIAFNDIITITKGIWAECSGSLSDGAINSNTGFQNLSNWNTTDFIEVKAGDVVLLDVTEIPERPYVFLQAYNRDKNVIENLFKNSAIYKVKEDGYIRVSGRKGAAYHISVKIATDAKKYVDSTDENAKLCQMLMQSVYGEAVSEVQFSFDGYINSNGEFVSHPLQKTTDFLDSVVILYDVKSDIGNLGAYINFFNADKQYLSSLSAQYKSNGIHRNELYMPEGAAYCRITCMKEYPSIVKVSKTGVLNTLKNHKVKHIKKNVNWMGHSIWWYDGNKLGGAGPIARGYQTLLKEQFSFDSDTDKKYCKSGHSLGGLNATDSTSLLKPAYLSQMTPSANAIWTLDTITNDFKKNIPLGNINDYNNNTGITTYYGALRVFRDKVIELSGNDAIVICANALRRNNSGYTSTSKNTVGCGLVDYEKALMIVAEKENWYFVDQYRMSGISDDTVMITTMDGLHPNNFGYKLAVLPWISVFDQIYNILLR